MSEFTIFDAAGQQLHSRACPDEFDELQAVGPGEILYRGAAKPGDTLDVATGTLIPGHVPVYVPPPPEPDYVRQRRAAYPTLQAQLEMLWDAMDAGTVPKAEPFYGVLKAVKTRFPKVIPPDHGKSIKL